MKVNQKEIYDLGKAIFVFHSVREHGEEYRGGEYAVGNWASGQANAGGPRVPLPNPLCPAI